MTFLKHNNWSKTKTFIHIQIWIGLSFTQSALVYKRDNGIGEEVDIKYETCDVWRYKTMKVNITSSQSWID